MWSPPMRGEHIWRAKGGRCLRVVVWATKAAPFCWFAAKAQMYTAYGDRLSAGLALTLLGCGFDVSTYWREPGYSGNN